MKSPYEISECVWFSITNKKQIVAIDPATENLGIAIYEANAKDSYTLVGVVHIKVNTKYDIRNRIAMIPGIIDSIGLKPKEVCIEQPLNKMTKGGQSLMGLNYILQYLNNIVNKPECIINPIAWKTTFQNKFLKVIPKKTSKRGNVLDKESYFKMVLDNSKHGHILRAFIERINVYDTLDAIAIGYHFIVSQGWKCTF